MKVDSRTGPLVEVSKRIDLVTPQELVRQQSEKLPILREVAGLPDLTNWRNNNPETKLHKIRQILSSPLYAVLTIGDHRLAPSEKDPLRTSYHNRITPWTEEALNYFGIDKYCQMMSENRVDEMVKVMGDLGKLVPGTNPELGWVSLAASTGSTPELSQYYVGLKSQDQLWEVVNNNEWDDAKNILAGINRAQQLRIKESYGFEVDDVLVTMQSGTEDPLLNILFGVTASQVTDETGTAQVAAASGCHTSPKGWKGFKYQIVPETKKMPKLAGYEKVRDAYEVKMRGKDRMPRSREDIKTEVRDWILRERENDPNSRLMIGVTAGGKTGSVGWEYGGLSLEDAIALRAEFGGQDGLGILIKVDGAQGKLSKEDIQKLKQLDVVFNWTGSKDDQGPMFESKTYVPKKYVELARDYIDKNGLPQGLTDYVVKSDLEELLGAQLLDKVGDQLDDMPNIPAMIKWDMVLATRDEYFKDKKALAELPNLVRDFGTIFRRKLSELDEGVLNINGHTWSARVLNEQPTEQRISTEFESLMSIEIKIDGQVVTGEQLKAIQFEMGNPGESGVEVQWGQAVSGAEVIRMVLGKATRTGLMRAWAERKAFGYTNKLCDVSIAKLSEVMRAKLGALDLFAEAGLEVKLAKESKGLSLAEMRVVANNLNERLAREIKPNMPMERKLGASIGAFSEVMDSDKIMPIVVMSGKDTATLDAASRAWGLSKQKGDMPVAFIDHRYVGLDKYGNYRGETGSVYDTMAQALIKYPRTHLYIFGAGKEVIYQLNKAGLGGRFTVVSKQPTKTNFEYEHPDWMLTIPKPLGEDGESVTHESKDKVYLTEEQARLINERNKSGPTREMFEYFAKIARGMKPAYFRGNRPGQSFARRNICPANVAIDGDYFGLHILARLSEQDVLDYKKRMGLLVTKGYRDLLKDAQNSCGTDVLFQFERQ